MPRRSRSRSPIRDYRRDRLDRDRERDYRRVDRGGRRSRSRERDRERERHRSRSRSPRRDVRDTQPPIPLDIPPPSVVQQNSKITAADFKGKTPEEIQMMKTMGFGSFDSTKGKQVDNNEYGVTRIVKRKRYRQYMNRRGGFNRALDSIT